MTKLIALCGAPGVGKSEVQNYLRKHYDVMAIDDGWPLRDFAMRHLGLSLEDVTTQAGKASVKLLPGGRHMFVRDALGELGNKVEELFGHEAIPEMALSHGLKQASAAKWKAISFGSVRRSQGFFYKSRGAKIIEIVRPGYEVTRDFDRYDQSPIDLTINNDSSLDALFARVEFHFAPWLERGLAL